MPDLSQVDYLLGSRIKSRTQWLCQKFQCKFDHGCGTKQDYQNLTKNSQDDMQHPHLLKPKNHEVGYVVLAD